MFSWGWAVLASTETVAKNVTIVTPSDKTGRDILIAAIVTVVGSIAVAFIAAATAGKRQKRALASADGQHTETLTAQAGQHTEALNNKVRLITRRAYGFHSAKAALALVLLTCGPITLTLPHELHLHP